MKIAKKPKFGFLFYLAVLAIPAALFILAHVDHVYAQESDENTGSAPMVLAGPSYPFLIKPVSRITFESFYYSDYTRAPYCFENTEGRCLTEEFQQIADIEGQALFGKKFFVFYKTEVDQNGKADLKKAYGLLRAGIWSLEVGQDTVWMGQGYHGSFLLSNNAEGFLLVRLRTEEPFSLPWIFSSLGKFKYDLFRGWSDNSSLLGQRLSWRPVPLLEIGYNQIVYIPPGKSFQIYDYPRVFFSNNDNSGSEIANRFDNDQKVSIDVALDMPFLNGISPFVNGKAYAEYGGNDIYAFWLQGKKWKGIGVEFIDIAWLAGLFLTTGDVDFRVEYADQMYTTSWYTKLNVREGMIMGHHMGGLADDLYIEMAIRHKPASVKIFYDLERHGIAHGYHIFTGPPEEKYEYGLRPAYQFRNFALFADLIYNHLRNVNASNDPLQFNIKPGTNRDEFIAGLGVEFRL